MGTELAEIKANRKKIALYTAMRLPWLAVFILGLFVGYINERGTATPNYAVIGLLLLLMIIYVLSPLRHLADVLTYYENKIVMNKKEIIFSNPSEIGWTTVKGYSRIFTGKRLVMHGKAEKTGIKEIFFPSNQIDVTYMDTAKEQFAQCYLKQWDTDNIK